MKLLTIVILTVLAAVAALRASSPADPPQAFGVICCESSALECRLLIGVPSCPPGWSEVACPCPDSSFFAE